ncbi:glycosyltransferase 87 family protein [Streptomyces mesophilus]|uniref:glycosyltransferase 87 family protein n=1 Tax=Streptomyces mesophilus TaxID=1775132 RepID=UPI0033268811
MITRTSPPPRALLLPCTLLAALVTALAMTFTQDTYFTDPGGLSLWYAVCWLLFAAAVWTLRKVPVREAAGLVLAGAIAVAATGLAGPPRTSTDSYRYAWDGRVQSAGLSPYDHPPAAAALGPLRDDWLFARGAVCGERDRSRIDADSCTRINRPWVHTIYPPVGELYFLAVDTASPSGARHKPLQIGGALLSVGVTGVLLLVARRRPRHAALWAWCPAVPVEAVNNAHADVLGVLFTVGGLTLLARARLAGTPRRGGLTGGALLGAATAAKLLPALALAGALGGVRRAGDAVRLVASALTVVALTYLPYVLLSDQSVLGYLGGYMEEEGYDDASDTGRFALLRLVLPEPWLLPAALLGMLLACGYVIARGAPERPWHGALLLTGTAFLLMTPGYSWYALLLIALAAFEGRGEWLLVAVAGAADYVTDRAVPDGTLAIGALAYATAATGVAAVSLYRARTSNRPHRARTSSRRHRTRTPGRTPAPDAPRPSPPARPGRPAGRG